MKTQLVKLYPFHLLTICYNIKRYSFFGYNFLAMTRAVAVYGPRVVVLSLVINLILNRWHAQHCRISGTFEDNLKS